MSHHIDSAKAREDGRLDLCDLYVFEGSAKESTVLIMTVNPLAGELSSTTFHPEALYAFHIDRNGDSVEELRYQLQFSEPDAQGMQSFELRRIEGEEAKTGKEGHVLATGRTGETKAIAGGGQVWAGLGADPFFGNGNGLQQFLQTLFGQDRFDPTAFAHHENAFHLKNVTGIALEVPNSVLSTQAISVWATTALLHNGQRFQINRAANPLMQHIFHTTEELKDAHNAGGPVDDLQRSGSVITGLVAKVVQLAHTADHPIDYGQQAAHFLLPDVLVYRPGTPANYGFAGRNGRHPSNDGMDVMLSVMANQPLSDGVGSEEMYQQTFPYLAQAHPLGKQGA